MTLKITDKCINCEVCEVARAAFAAHPRLAPTPEQIERGLSDASPKVRCAIAGRTDYTPTRAQIARGLKDAATELAFLARPDVHLTSAQNRIRLARIERGLSSR